MSGATGILPVSWHFTGNTQGVAQQSAAPCFFALAADFLPVLQSPDRPLRCYSGRFTAALASRRGHRAGKTIMAGQGSSGNVIAALCSLFIPGLGQLLQGRMLAAVIQFVLATALWFIFMGWVVHIWSIIDAARWKGPA
jgi:TM2 domain-containing membrane protein YozV